MALRSPGPAFARVDFPAAYRGAFASTTLRSADPSFPSHRASLGSQPTVTREHTGIVEG
jgi:hypothetical protein